MTGKGIWPIKNLPPKGSSCKDLPETHPNLESSPEKKPVNQKVQVAVENERQKLQTIQNVSTAIITKAGVGSE